MRRRSMVSLAVVLFLPAALQSQVDSSARLMGYAKSSFNGRLLVGVMIAVPAARKFAVSDSSGRFELRGLPAGQQLVRISYLGRNTEEYTFDLPRGRTKRLEVLLDADAVDLAPIVVEAQHPDGWLDLGGFYARRRWYKESGRFFTREDIERNRAASLEQVVAWDGIFTRCVQGGCVPTRMRRGQPCVVAVKIDGRPFFEADAVYNDTPIGDVAAVEVYPANSWDFSPTAFPTNLGYSNAGRALKTCGTVLIWTRR